MHKSPPLPRLNPPQANASPWRYSLRDAGGAVLLLSLTLAATLQLGGVGLCLSGFATCYLCGRRFELPQLISASICAGVTFVLTFVLAWIVCGGPGNLERREYASVKHYLDESVRTFRAPDGSRRRSVLTAPPGHLRNLPWEVRGEGADAELWYLGREGLVGGRGFEADLSPRNVAWLVHFPVPLLQFLAWEADRRVVQVAAAIAAVGAACAGLMIQGRSRGSYAALLGLALTFACFGTGVMTLLLVAERLREVNNLRYF